MKSLFWMSIFGWLAVACFTGWQEDRLRRLTAERDRLLAELATSRRANSRLHTGLLEAEARGRELDVAPVRGPYPDGQSSEKYDPWRPGTRQVSVFSFAVPGSGVCAVTVDPSACAAGPLVPGLPSPPTGVAAQGVVGDRTVPRGGVR